MWSGRLARYRRSLIFTGGVAVATALALGAASVGQTVEARNTEANYTPNERFEPLAASSPCVGEPGGKQAKPFVVPTGYDQRVVAEEPEGGTEDLWDMNTQNEFGKDAGRYVYRTHEVAAAPSGSNPQTTPGGAQVSVTDLKTGQAKVLAERADWERFDGIVWTPWGTILAAEETSRQGAPDPQVPQARGGLVYEFFVDPDDPTRLDPSREKIAPGDGTADTVKDGIRARPALGAKSHEGMRFDKRGFHYGISETRGQTTAGQAGAIFRFVPDRKGDLSKGQLQALQTNDRRYGEGRWIDLDRTQVQIDADAEAERKGANEYERPEDVETGQSTGVDKNNGGNTLYVAMTEGPEEGVTAVDLSSKDRPFAYPYVGKIAGNASEPEFDSPDNLALDSQGNLAITEDPPVNPIGADIWVAKPPRSQDDDGENGSRHQPASEVERFASLKDCAAEPTGIYFALEGTSKFTEGTPREALVTDESLFVDRQHSGQGTTNDQLVSINPVDDNGSDEDDN
ncbi:MAG TPA: alkaline phosphatase PhoX [Rubrobacter sp.]|nr:alkaline phosphatase PhoX [Rubrobacter sp.]